MIGGLLLVLVFLPRPSDKPTRCRIVEIMYHDDDWRTTKEVLVREDARYVIRLFSAAPPYALRCEYRGRLQRELHSSLLKSVETDAFWTPSNGVPTYRYAAHNTKTKDPEIIRNVRHILWREHIYPEGWCRGSVRWVKDVLGLP